MSRHPWWLALAIIALLASACTETVEVGGNKDIANNDVPNNDVNNDLPNNDAPNNDLPNNDTPNNDAPNNDPQPVGTCEGGSAFVDVDEDGFGSDETIPCEAGQELAQGSAGTAGDCGPTDPLQHPGAEGICGDFVDDDCDGQDEACPESQPSVVVPEWDCTGDAPSSVFAWARFDNGEGFFNNGGCFYFFEGLPGEFYVKRNIDRANTDPSCETRNGCTCPSLNGWPAYDRRMYAFTTRPDLGDDCPEISIRDHGGEQQPVSNGCRKYLYQMHAYDIPYSFFAGSVDALRQRLEVFSTVEIICVEDAPHANLPFQPLINAQVELNPNYQPMP